MRALAHSRRNAMLSRAISSGAARTRLGALWQRGLCELRSDKPQVTLLRPEDQGNGVSVLQLNVPQRRNALSTSVVASIRGAVEEVNAGPGHRVLVVASALENVFCAGADLRERAGMSPSEQGQAVRELRGVFDQLARCRVPTIAVVEGAALGGGAELALACDIRVASTSAIFGFPETRLAIIPGAGGTQRLPRIVGPSRAKEMIFTGRRIAADEALKFGLIDFLVDNARGMGKALALGEQMLEGGPLALGLAKRAIDDGLSQDMSDALETERYFYEQTLETSDRAEGVRAFNEKRKPEFVGR